MSALNDELARLVAPFAPHAHGLVDAAATHALRLHAEELSPEHLASGLLLDEEGAAHRAIVHLFADPETIHAEVMALSPGVLVVGSGRSLPFSVRAVDVLRRARGGAVARGAGSVGPGDLLAAAVDALDADASDDLTAAGYAAEALTGRSSDRGEAALPEAGPLLSAFREESMVLCGVACRVAVQLERDAISPAHLIFAAVERDPELRERSGLELMPTRALLTGRDADPTPPPPRTLSATQTLVHVLEGAPAGADSLDLMRTLAARGPAELRLLLGQHRVEVEALDGLRGRFEDPGGA